MKIGKKLNLCLLLLIAFAGSVAAQELITNVYGRDIHSLMVNGMPLSTCTIRDNE